MVTIARQSALVLASRAGLLAIGFANTVLTARLLQPEGRGVYAIVMAVLNLFSLVIGAIANAVALSAAHEEAATLRRTTSATIGIGLIVGALPLLAVLIWRPNTYWYAPTLVGLASTPLILLTASVQLACIGTARLRWYVALQLIQPTLMVLLGVPLMVWRSLGLLGAMIAWTGSWAVTVLLGIYVLYSLGWRLRLAELAPWRSRRLIAFGLGASIYSTFTAFTNRSLLFVVQSILGLNAAGVFSITITLAEPLSYMSSALSAVAYSRLAPEATRSREALRFLGVAAILSIGGAIVIMTLSTLFMVSIFGEEYRLANAPLPLFLLGYIVLSGREIATLFYVHEEKSYAGPIRAAATAYFLTLVLALPAVTVWGPLGAASAALIGATVLMSIMLRGLHKRGVRLHRRSELDRQLGSTTWTSTSQLRPRNVVTWIRAMLSSLG